MEKIATATVTGGARLSANVGAILRARNALIWLVSPEEGRMERACIETCAAAKYPVRLWDCVQGVTDAAGKETGPGRSGGDPAVTLAAIRDSRERAVWVLRDLTPWVKDPTVCRALRNLARALPSSPRDEARAIIVLSPTADVPPELSDLAVIVQWELPDRVEIAAIFDNVLAGLPSEVAANAAPEGVREAAIDAAVGLSAEAAAAAYAKSLVTQDKRIVPSVVATEKKRAISGKGLEWFDADPRGLSAVGGLEPLKAWLTLRQSAFTQRARDFGLPLPKGMMLVGVPGCGKSLVAKAVAAAWGVPLLRCDLGGAKSKWVGESEANIRQVFAVAEAVGRCVLWIDEIEKALGGATGGAADGGVSSDALGTFLSWLQERKGSVFVIATANDVSKLPPELLRKGRFDEMFFVDLPTLAERREILTVTLAQYARDAATVDVARIAGACGDFTGSEVAAIVPDALFAAFADGERALSTDDLLGVALSIVPLAKTASEKVKALREWSNGRARPSSLPEINAATGADRNLDL
jgi:hypothetical protein